MYQDAINLYGCNMIEYLPYKEKRDNYMSNDFILKIRDDHWKGVQIRGRPALSGGATWQV